MTRRKDAATDAPAETATGPDLPEADADLPAGESAQAVAPEAVPESPAPETPQAPPPVPARRSGVMGPLLGGALAALGGFGLSHFNILGFAAQDQSAEVAALGQRLDAAVAALETGQAGLESGLQRGIDDLATRLGTLEAAPSVDQSGLATLEQRLQVIEALPPGGDASTAALAAKLADLEQRLAALPAGGAGTAEVDAALARLAEVEAEAKARAAEAEAAAAATAQARALEVLAAAAASGAGFEAELAEVTNPDLQAALAPHVAGVASLAQLQSDFPAAARVALQLARASDTEAGWGVRFVDFLGAQTGARSLTPREGTKPDAVLSRAEFALGEGRLADTLAELGTLDPTVQAPFADWVAAARARMAVDAALAGAL